MYHWREPRSAQHRIRRRAPRNRHRRREVLGSMFPGEAQQAVDTCARHLMEDNDGAIMTNRRPNDGGPSLYDSETSIFKRRICGWQHNSTRHWCRRDATIHSIDLGHVATREPGCWKCTTNTVGSVSRRRLQQRKKENSWTGMTFVSLFIPQTTRRIRTYLLLRTLLAHTFSRVEIRVSIRSVRPIVAASAGTKLLRCVRCARCARRAGCARRCRTPQ
jgi:hypothetical protein